MIMNEMQFSSDWPACSVVRVNLILVVLSTQVILCLARRCSEDIRMLAKVNTMLSTELPSFCFNSTTPSLRGKFCSGRSIYSFSKWYFCSLKWRFVLICLTVWKILDECTVAPHYWHSNMPFWRMKSRPCKASFFCLRFRLWAFCFTILIPDIIYHSLMTNINLKYQLLGE